MAHTYREAEVGGKYRPEDYSDKGADPYCGQFRSINKLRIDDPFDDEGGNGGARCRPGEVQNSCHW